MASSSSGTQANTSVSQFVSTLIFNLVIFAVFLGIFLIMRKRQRRVYEPRFIVDTVPSYLKTDETPTGLFSWLTHILNKPESFLIRNAGIDGYFFIRFLFEFAIICFLGAIIIFPILFPINATGGNGEKGFDILSYSNVKNENRFYAHIFLSWIYFGSVIFIIYRELVYYVSFRHAAQATPLYSSLLSSRTLLLTELADSLLTESELRAVFPIATNIWYARDYRELEDKVKERTKLAKKYENTLNKVISKSVKKRAKLLKKGKPLPENETDFTSYIKKRPTHRLKWPLIGKKVDTLDYSVEHLDELTKEISEKQENFTENEQVGSVFIEFPSQLECQRAYQAVPYHDLLKKSRRYTGLAPNDIVWENVSLGTHARYVKYVGANALLTVTIIFWAIPVAVVGAISNINLLIEKVHFLKFIDNLPKALMGLITGILPTVALAVLMSLLPPYMKKLGKVGGAMSLQQVEGYCHSWYYAFQVVQVFLVTTIASAATSVVTTIIDDPSSAMSLLSGKVPKAANFYISYLLLQGLSVSSGALLQLVTLILSQVLGRLLDSTPRAKWNRYNNLSSPSWGVVYPVYQLLVAIALCYSIIAPLILGFSAVAFVLIWVAYIYNLTYVMTPNANDARGGNYPKALFQIFVGLYLAEAVLIALFVFAKNWGAVVLEAVILAVTAASHIWFKRIFLPLLDTVPVGLLSKNPNYVYPINDLGLKEIKATGQAYFSDSEILDSNESESTKSLHDATNDEQNIDIDIENENDQKSNPFKDEKSGKIDTSNEEENFIDTENVQTTPISTNKYSWVQRFFKPKQLENFISLTKIMPDTFQQYIQYNDDYVRTAYLDPAVSDEEPKIWIGNDPIGLAEIEIEKAQGKVFVTNENTAYDEKGKLNYTGPPPSYEEAIKV